ncbi:hypothetical protein KR200_009938 [Drosophila serrata]|nr:hypothetical protein KR200_009938 [Drosophila serrata]
MLWGLSDLRTVLIVVVAAVRRVGRRRAGANLLLQGGSGVLPPQPTAQNGSHAPVEGQVEEAGYVADGDQGPGDAEQRSGENVGPVVPVVHHTAEGRVPGQHDQHKLHKVAAELGAAPGELPLQVDRHVHHGIEDQAGVAAGEAEPRLPHILDGVALAGALVVLHVAVQVRRVRAEAAVRQLRLAHGQEVRSQASDGVLAHLGGVEGEEHAEAEVGGLPGQLHVPGGNAPSEQVHRGRNLSGSQVAHVLHQDEEENRQQTHNQSQHHRRYRIVPERVADALVVAEEPPPDGIHRELVHADRYEEDHEYQQLQEQAMAQPAVRCCRRGACSGGGGGGGGGGRGRHRDGHGLIFGGVAHFGDGSRWL